MSRLEKLIAELCPDGVERRKLLSICEVYDGTHQTPKYTDSGVKFVSVENILAPYETKKYISESDYSKFKVTPKINDVLMTRIGSIGVCTVIDRDEPLAYYVSLALLRPDNNVINSRFLKYVIESRHGQRELYKRTLVNAVPIKVNTGDIGKISVPVPPLEVQQAIVRMLDSFALYTAELTAELSKELQVRKQQYDYYREQLLTFGTKTEKKCVQEICDIARGKVISKGDIRDNPGQYPVYSSQTENNGELGKISSYMYDGEYLTWTTDGANAGSVFYRNGKFNITNVCGLLKVNSQNVDIRYLFHALRIEASKHVSRGMGNPKLMSNVMGSIKICLPSLSEQKHIAHNLDNLDSIHSNISACLSAEIEARLKQYEYYRDKILTFKESKTA